MSIRQPQHWWEVDENADDLYAALPDKEFVETREAILRLLPKLFREGSCRYSSLDVVEYLVDDTVAEIAGVWIP